MANKQLLQSKQQKLTVMTKKVFRAFPPQNDVSITWWEAE